MTQNQEKCSSILDFWFENRADPPESARKKWFMKSDDFDKKIKELFYQDIISALESEPSSWTESAEIALAGVILLDQFTRNVFRDSPEAFSGDTIALLICKNIIRQNKDLELNPFERVFLYVPFMHSENLEDQKTCVKLFEKLINSVDESIKDRFTANLDYAEQHLEVIEKFGRFPHRNAILERLNTEEEIEYLNQPGSGF